MPETVLFANPTAQSGKAAAIIDEARRLLSAAGIDHEFQATEPQGGTLGVVRQSINHGGARRIIYMGGDGTFAEVAKGILGSDHAGDVAMGMLPTGTANDQGKSFGLAAGASALARNVEVIAAGATIDIDVGRIQRLDEADQVTDSNLFFDSMSIGFGAEVLATRNRDRETVASIPGIRAFYRDHLVYAGAFIKKAAASLVSKSKFDLEVEVDGQSLYYESLIDVIFNNTHVFGGEWVLAPNAEPDDGLFEMTPVAGRADYTTKLLTTLRHHPVTEQDLEKLGFEYSKPVAGSSFTLTVIQPGAATDPAVQIDGEEFPRGTKYRVDVLPRILHLIVPRDEARASG